MIRIFVFAFFITLCTCHTADKSKWRKLICTSNGHYGPSPEVIADLEKCGDGQCNFKCETEAIGNVNADGTYTLDLFEDYAQTVVPTSFREITIERLRSCYKQYGPQLAADDETCSNARGFTDCVWSLLPLMVCVPPNVGTVSASHGVL